MFQHKYNKQKFETKPKLLAETHWGGERTLMRALESGQAWENADGSVSWSERTQVDKKGSGQEYNLGGKKGKLDDQAALMIEDAFRKLGWGDLQQKYEEVKKQRTSTSNGEPPKPCLELLDEALISSEALLKESDRISCKLRNLADRPEPANAAWKAQKVPRLNFLTQSMRSCSFVYPCICIMYD